MQLTLLAVLLLVSSFSWAMQPLSDSSLAQVRAGEKIIFNVSLRNNVDANLNPQCGSAYYDSYGLTPCRIGLALAGQAGQWLMLNGDYGTLHIRDIQLDAVFLPTTNTPYMDLSRFLTQSGACLISGQTAANCNPAGKIALVADYPVHGDPSTTPYPTDSPPSYNDLTMFFHIDQMTLVADSNAASCAGGYGTVSACGFNQPAGTASFLGYHLSDAAAQNSEAQMRFVGRAYVYGF